MKLSELHVGQSAVIKKVNGNGNLRRRILEMGIIPRTIVHMRKPAPMGDPLKVFLRNYELSLRHEEASWVEVEIVEAK